MSAYDLKQTMIVCSVPGHRIIPGNELADQSAAAAALHCEIDVPQLSYLDIKPFIPKALGKRWQQHWDTQAENKIGSCYTEQQKCTCADYLRIGHT